MESLVGHQLGKYQLQAEIGRGGMAVVYRGYDTVLERNVAIKIMAQHLTWEAGALERFLREARAAAQLKHPNIITIHDIGNEAGWYYIVMELIDGCSLKDLLQKTHLPLAEAIQILEQVAGALDYAHQHGVVHRDVKPGNILVESDGRAVLTDFGIAKAAQQTRLTASGLAIGTPEYLSPEQARGLGGDLHSDIYSLGIVAYQLLGGAVPFSGEDTLAVLHKHVYERPAPIRTLRPELPGSIEAVFRRVLAKEPEARYPSAGALVEALERVLPGKKPAGEKVRRPIATPIPGSRSQPLAEAPTSAVGISPADSPTIAAAAPTTPAAGQPVSRARRRLPALLSISGVVLLLLLGVMVVIGPRLRGGAAPVSPTIRTLLSNPSVAASPTQLAWASQAALVSPTGTLSPPSPSLTASPEASSTATARPTTRAVPTVPTRPPAAPTATAAPPPTAVPPTPAPPTPVPPTEPPPPTRERATPVPTEPPLPTEPPVPTEPAPLPTEPPQPTALPTEPPQPSQPLRRGW